MKINVKFVGLIMCFMLLCSCTASYSSQSFIAMDTYIELKADVKDTKIIKSVKDEVVRLSNIYNCHSKSQLSELNSSGTAKVPDELCELIKLSIKYAKDTNGAFNPALYNITSLWNINSDMTEIPSDKAITNALKSCNYNDISVNGNTVTLKNGTKIDLGAIAKGYISQVAVDMLKEKGTTSAVLSFGGNIALIGQKDGKTDWSVAIQDPRGQDDEYIGILNANDCFVVTSGDYERYAEINGVRYHHIFAKDGYPANSELISVTVVCDNGTKADALSTALFVMGIDKSLELYKSSNDFEAIFVTADKKIIVTDGIKDNFTPNGGEYSYED